VIVGDMPLKAEAIEQRLLHPRRRNQRQAPRSSRVYGMARPSFRRRRLAGVSGGGRAMAKISVLGIDLGKNVCSVVGLDASGASRASSCAACGKSSAGAATRASSPRRRGVF
jgi:hypothetical protein